MRHRRWVIVAAVLVIAVLPLTFLAFKIGSRHPDFKRAILARVLPEADAELSIGELEVGLASLTFGDVRIDLGENGLIEIPSASVNMSYRKLLASGLSVRSSLGSVILSGPSVVIEYGGRPGGAGADSASQAVALSRYLPDYLGVSDAELTLVDRTTRRSLRLTSVDLLMQRLPDGTVRGSAVGDAMGGSENLTCDMSCDCDASTLGVTGRLAGGSLSAALPLPESSPLKFRGGVATSDFGIVLTRGGRPTVTASFDVVDATVEAVDADETVTVDRLSGRYENGVLTIDHAAGRWRAAPWSGSCALDTRTEFLDRLELRADRVPLAAVAAWFEGAPSVEGLAAFDVFLEGPLSDATASVDIASAALHVGDTALTDVVCGAVVSRDSMKAMRADASLFGGRASIEGTGSRSGPTAPWYFRASGRADTLDLALVAGALGLGEARGRLSLADLEFAGTVRSFDAEALASWSRAELGRVNVGDGAGGFLLREGDLAVTFASRDGGVSLSGEVTDVFGDAALDVSLDMNGAVVESLWPAAPALLAGLEVNGEIGAVGAAASPSLRGSVLVRSDEVEATVDLEGEVLGGPAGSALEARLGSADARVRGVELPFESRLRVSSEGLDVTELNAGGFLEGALSAGLGANRDLTASLVVSEAPLADVLRLATGSSPRAIDGLVFASASVGGTLDRPRATFQLQAGNVEAAGVEGLDAALVGELDDDLVTVREFVLREDGRPFAEASGTLTVGGLLEMAVRGEAIPGPLLGGSEDSTFDATAGLGGTTDGPTLDARVESRDGVFLGVAFDSFVARLTGAAGTISLDPLALEREDRYRVSAVGDLPVGALLGRPGAPEAGLTIEVDGDPLAFLAELSPVLASADGEGTMSVHLVGVRDNVTVARATLEATAESVKPTALFSEIEDVTVSASALDGVLVTGFVEGSIDGRPILLESQRGRVVNGRRLYPFVLGGLDVGILALSTGPDGVRASVPGLMLADDYGHVAVKGRGEEPALLVSGPPEHPLLWGELTYSDVSFTYPFLKSEGGFGGDFLSRSEWSVLMTAGRNVWYWRPDVNLAIERGGSLDFVGIPEEHSMCISGRLYSSNGTVTYLNNDFSVEEASVEFPPLCEPPRFSAEATMRVDDGTEITLRLDPAEAAQAFAAQGASLDESAITLSSDDPDDRTQQEVLARLTYGGDYEGLEGDELAAIERRTAMEVIGGQIGGMVVRPLLSPIEARIRRGLRLDRVRIDVDFFEQFFSQIDRWTAQEGSYDYTPFLARSRLTLGKYLWSDWLLSYVGLAEAYEEEIGYQSLGLRHELGIEYEVSRNTSLSLKAVYDPSLAGWDRRITIENRYEF